MMNLHDKRHHEGIPWRSSDEGSALSLPRARVPSLVRELRSCKPHSMDQKQKKDTKNKVKRYSTAQKNIHTLTQVIGLKIIIQNLQRAHPLQHGKTNHPKEAKETH